MIDRPYRTELATEKPLIATPGFLLWRGRAAAQLLPIAVLLSAPLLLPVAPLPVEPQGALGGQRHVAEVALVHFALSRVVLLQIKKTSVDMQNSLINYYCPDNGQVRQDAKARLTARSENDPGPE